MYASAALKGPSHQSNISPTLLLAFVTVMTQCTPHSPVILYYYIMWGFIQNFFLRGEGGGGGSLASDLARIIMIYV